MLVIHTRGAFPSQLMARVRCLTATPAEVQPDDRKGAR
jgi:hypothetical protein